MRYCRCPKPTPLSTLPKRWDGAFHARGAPKAHFAGVSVSVLRCAFPAHNRYALIGVEVPQSQSIRSAVVAATAGHRRGRNPRCQARDGHPLDQAHAPMDPAPRSDRPLGGKGEAGHGDPARSRVPKLWSGRPHALSRLCSGDRRPSLPLRRLSTYLPSVRRAARPGARLRARASRRCASAAAAPQDLRHPRENYPRCVCRSPARNPWCTIHSGFTKLTRTAPVFLSVCV